MLVEIIDSDQAKTAFVILLAIRYLLVTTAPIPFQCFMQILCDIIPPKCVVYLDEVIVYRETKNEYLNSPVEVLDRLVRVVLVLEPSICHILREELTYLGRIISGFGIRTNQSKTEQTRYRSTSASVDL